MQRYRETSVFWSWDSPFSWCRGADFYSFSRLLHLIYWWHLFSDASMWLDNQFIRVKELFLASEAHWECMCYGRNKRLPWWWESRTSHPPVLNPRNKSSLPRVYTQRNIPKHLRDGHTLEASSNHAEMICGFTEFISRNEPQTEYITTAISTSVCCYITGLLGGELASRTYT